MEILFVSHKYPPATGGMEKQSFELIKGMKQYAKVHKIVYEGRESRISFFLKLNARINRLWKANPGISIIHFNDALIASVSLTHYGYTHLKRTMTVHGLDVVFPSSIYRRFILPKFNQFDLIIAVSQATKTACMARNIKEEKVLVIQNGVDTTLKNKESRANIDLLLKDKYHLNSAGKKILVAMGRPVKRKGFSWFIQQVMPGLHEDFILIMIGPAMEESNTDKYLQRLPAFIRNRLELFLGYPSDAFHIRKLLKDPIISKKVMHLGKLPLQELTSIIGVSDAYVMPNIPIPGDMEGFGLVCLEAAMCGTRVFASNLEGITDAIHHKQNGFLVTPADEKAWIETLNELQKDSEDLSLSADKIIAFTQEYFSWQRMNARYAAGFKQLIND